MKQSLIKVVNLDSVADWQSVRQFILDSLAEFGFKYDRNYDTDLDNLKEYYAADKRIFFAAFKNQQLIATIGVIPLDLDKVKIVRFYVKKEERGKGLGSLLFKKTLTFAKKHGYSFLITETTRRNKEAIRFFLKKGFKIKQIKRSGFILEKNITT
jgi:GNAT superfamily N-acetyltransferase